MECCETYFGHGRKCHATVVLQVVLFVLLITCGIMTAAPVGWQVGSGCVLEASYQGKTPVHMWLWHVVTYHAAIVVIVIPLLRLAVVLWRFYSGTLEASVSRYHRVKAILSGIHTVTTIGASIILTTEFQSFCIYLEGATTYTCQEMQQQLDLTSECLADHQYFYGGLVAALVATWLSSVCWFLVLIHDGWLTACQCVGPEDDQIQFTEEAPSA